MKKLITLLLASVMVLATFAACAAGTPNESTEPGQSETDGGNDTPVVNAPGSALELLQNVWTAIPEDERFMVMGGDTDANVMGEPGTVNVSNADFMSYTLLVPAEQLANVTDAASMMFAMNANSFTAAAFRVSGDMNAFTAAMRDAVQGNTWMCGFPEQLMIYTVGDYCVMVFGLAGREDPMGNFLGGFTTAMGSVYPEATLAYDEAIA